jgi:hypothetical protein
MSVNGVEIAVGQRWRRRDGSERVIERAIENHDYVWKDQRGSTYTDMGLFSTGMSHTFDLVELVVTGDSTQATTFGTIVTDPDDVAARMLQDADALAGWIDWRGGECPVASDVIVQYRTRGGTEIDVCAARHLDWKLQGDDADIVAYRELGAIDGSLHAVPSAASDPGRTNPKDLIGDKKLALHLLSPIAEAHWVVGQYAGMLKYGAWNWREAGVRASVYISAARRHLAAYLSGEEHDPTDGSHHLGNVMACCAILLEAREIGKLTDDRPPCFSHRPAYAWAEDRMAQLKVQYADMHPKHYSIADRPPAVERKKADDTEGGAL